jgi:CDP-diacylglycerol--glycerol-3-phosphate 3-phosphatidyltransferase
MSNLVSGGIVLFAGLAVVVAFASSNGLRTEPVERVERAGSSPFLGLGIQRTAYRALQLVGRALHHARVKANGVTLASLPLAAGAAVALAREDYGVGALLGGAAFACDALDGMIARASGTTSVGGALLDVACDRISEALLFGGLVIAWRSSVPLLVLVLLAALGSQQVTLASAKAEAHPLVREVPRGVMRRAERGVFLVTSTALAGVLLETLPTRQAADIARLPPVLALAAIALFGNVSALSRFASLARALRGSGPSSEGATWLAALAPSIERPPVGHPPRSMTRAGPGFSAPERSFVGPRRVVEGSRR